MAIMIPYIPSDYQPESREGEMFEALEKLPDDYYVFHSFKMVDIVDNEWKEHEIDFVIFNEKKGILALEAKAGQVWCDNGIWKYGNGMPMKRSPFVQANDNKWTLLKKTDKLRKSNDITNNCKFLSAVWFPSLEKKAINKLNFPQDTDPELIMSSEDLDNPLKTIEKIFNINVSNITTKLSLSQKTFILSTILCPTFIILPSKTLELDYKHQRFDEMIKEQCNLLNYLEEQKAAVINGAAGTGKTMMALEKARRHSVAGDRILFLCYNKKLKEYLENNYKYKNVDYYTIDGYACFTNGTSIVDYDELLEKLLNIATSDCNAFPYDHVIVDEGQDFGQDNIPSDDIFECLEEIVLKKNEKGSFYIFYDKNQLIQGDKIPKFINDADCRLTLYKNCRNTKRIAETSFKPLLKLKPKLISSAIEGKRPEIMFVQNSDSQKLLDEAIKKAISDGYSDSDIQILTCKTVEKSAYRNLVDDDLYLSKGKKIKFTTCRKFKGLEADKIIVVDADLNTFVDDSKVFYVGTSRARLSLTIIADLSIDDATKLVDVYFNSNVKRGDPYMTLSKLLGCDNCSK